MDRRTESGGLFFGASALLVAVWLLYFLRLHDPAFPAIVYMGWITLASGLLLIFVAIGTLSAQGRPEGGQDFTHTTRLVDHGIYAVIRHPLYLGWALMFVAAMLFSQHWLVIILALAGVGCLYGIMRSEEGELVKRFGSVYEQYMLSVPRMNFLEGILRLLAKRESP